MLERRIMHFLLRFMRSPLGRVAESLVLRIYPRHAEGWVEVNELEMILPRLDPAFDGLRIAQISDFHIGTWLTRDHLEQVVTLINQQAPDLVAITGDYVTFDPLDFLPDLVETMRRLEPKHAVVGILGNHDHWSNPGLVRHILQLSGVIDLSNSYISLTRGSAQLHIAGIDDYMDGQDCLDAVLAKLPSDGAAILLAHEPDFAEVSAKTGRFDLQISGHSHGGQIVFPWLGPVFLPHYARKYPSGFYQVGGMALYTNRGLGTAEIPLRVNCPAEITIFKLKSAC